MKRYIYATSMGILIIAGTSVHSTFAATNNTPSRQLPAEFSVLTEAELETLKTLTGTTRDEYLASKGITRPTSGSGQTDKMMPKVELTEAEMTAVATMTEDERKAFFESKGITLPVGDESMNQRTGSGKTQNTRTTRVQTKTQAKTETVSTDNTTTLTRAERIAQYKAKQLEQRKTKILKKIADGESLTRLEQKFADANDIEY